MTKEPVLPSSPLRLFTVNSINFPPSSSALTLDGLIDAIPVVIAAIDANFKASRRSMMSSEEVDAKSVVCDTTNA